MADTHKSSASRMTDYEAFMWHIEQDPWLANTMSSICILERPPDFDELERRVRNAVAEIPHLRHRVQPGLSLLTPPTFETDPEFNFDHHLRHISMPAGSTRRDLFDLAISLIQDPFDRTRPLWLIVVIDGLPDGQAALFVKLHHTIADGTAAIKLATQYMTLSPDAPLPGEVDVDALIAREAHEPAGIPSLLLDAASYLVGRRVGTVTETVSEIARTVVHPSRIALHAREVVDTIKVTLSQIRATESEASRLWADRSRHRRFEGLSFPFAEAHHAAKALGGTLNDWFLTGALEGAARYHRAFGSSPQKFTVSFVVSTRPDLGGGQGEGNEFTIIPVELPAGEMPLRARFDAVHDIVTELKSEVHGSGMFNAMAGVMNMLPTSVMTAVSRNRAGHVDFGTSNVPGAPCPVYVGGAKVLEVWPLGPVGATSFLVVLLSYNGTVFLGFTLDSHAVKEPEKLRDMMRSAFADLIAAGGGRPDRAASATDAGGGVPA